VITPYFIPSVHVIGDSVTITIAESSTGYTTVGNAACVYPKGSWFASPYAMLAHAAYLFNTLGDSGSAVPSSSQITVSMVWIENGHADNGKLKMTWSSGNNMTVAITDGASKAGSSTKFMIGTNADSATYSSGTAFAGVQHNLVSELTDAKSFFPSYPVLSFDRFSETQGGYVKPTVDGSTVYSVRGAEIQGANMTLNIKADATNSEHNLWRNIVTNKLMAGFSVHYIPDPSTYTVLINTDKLLPYMGESYALFLPEPDDIAYDRLIREKHDVYTSGPYKFNFFRTPTSNQEVSYAEWTVPFGTHLPAFYYPK
tara:strand:- start:1416 stop:2354 length:939 start_codon:yes stop_codon:yes gene_type:complete